MRFPRTSSLGSMRRFGVVTTVAAAAVVTVASMAVGTTGSGVSATPNPPVRGTAEDKVMTRGNEAYDVVSHDVTFAAGGHSGWHTHPGQAIVVIKSGTFTVYDAKTCTAQVYGPGEVFVDRGYGDVHIARNEGAVPTEVRVTYLDVPVGGAFRIDAADPGTCA